MPNSACLDGLTNERNPHKRKPSVRNTFPMRGEHCIALHSLALLALCGAPLLTTILPPVITIPNIPLPRRLPHVDSFMECISFKNHILRRNVGPVKASKPTSSVDSATGLFCTDLRRKLGHK